MEILHFSKIRGLYTRAVTDQKGVIMMPIRLMPPPIEVGLTLVSEKLGSNIYFTGLPFGYSPAVYLRFMGH